MTWSASGGEQRGERETLGAQSCVLIEQLGPARLEMQMRVGVRLRTKLRNQQRHCRHQGNAHGQLSGEHVQMIGLSTRL